jgi:hypothetical protein
METLIACVALLPAEVIGAHVISFLSLKTIARLDCAVAAWSYRGAFEEALSYSSICITYKYSTPRQTLWAWCLKRLVTIKELQFSDISADDVVSLEKVLCRVPNDGEAHWSYNTSGKTVENDDAVAQQLQHRRKQNYTPRYGHAI